MGFTSNVYVDVLIYQLPLYAVVVGCGYASWLAVNRRKHLLALFLAVAAIFPLVSYVYAIADARFVAPNARKAEVASWPRERITPDNRPHVFLTTWMNFGGSIAKVLVELARFERAYGLIGDDWYSFERVAGSACAEPHYNALSLYRQDQVRKSTACVSVTKVGRRFDSFPQIAEPHLRLLTDEAAPSRDQNGGRVYSSSTLELRLVSSDHNNLVSFWEAPYFDAPAFPPIFMYRDMDWSRESFRAEHLPHPEPIKFVLDALGNT
ncbi:hypothetical protein [Bradyrhizobium japonicum]|uniref:hypothetical protein n=1 Tax=Bradyrhizobium japonicum TaxID=375 RepID=UPI001BAC826E|nr:hypothetical protein [Bradyrhizobium japonicum]MBR0956386.1 hypothetical protein [Bradyrhizobium japonicum]